MARVPPVDIGRQGLPSPGPADGGGSPGYSPLVACLLGCSPDGGSPPPGPPSPPGPLWPPSGAAPPVGSVVVSTPTISDTARPESRSPVTVASWEAPPSSPKTLSSSRLTSARLVTDCSYPEVAYTCWQMSSGKATWEVAIAFVASVISSSAEYTSKWMCGHRPV